MVARALATDEECGCRIGSGRSCGSVSSHLRRRPKNSGHGGREIRGFRVRGRLLAATRSQRARVSGCLLPVRDRPCRNVAVVSPLCSCQVSRAERGYDASPSFLGGTFRRDCRRGNGGARRSFAGRCPGRWLFACWRRRRGLHALASRSRRRGRRLHAAAAPSSGSQRLLAPPGSALRVRAPLSLVSSIRRAGLRP